MATSTDGSLTVISVSTDGTTFEPLCILDQKEFKIHYGKYDTKEDYVWGCSDTDTILAFGKKTYDEQSFVGVWSEGNGSAANKIIKDAHASHDTINVRVEADNSQGSHGTQYTSGFKVTDYGHTFKDEETNGSFFTIKQLSDPIEVASA